MNINKERKKEILLVTNFNLSTRADQAGLRDVQILLDIPQVKVREVIDVRWLAIRNAVNSIYNMLDSLITYFVQEADKNPKAAGLLKKIPQADFIAVTNLMMDVLPIVSKLCM